jgi:hypothetical protein
MSLWIFDKIILSFSVICAVPTFTLLMMDDFSSFSLMHTIKPPVASTLLMAGTIILS